MVTSHLWDVTLAKGSRMEAQRGLMRASIARYEILRLFGGLYVDCDLIWLGAQRPRLEHAPTRKLLAHVDTAPPPVITTPHYMQNGLDVGRHPIPLTQPSGTEGVFAGGMTAMYLNNAFMAAPPDAPLIKALLKHLPNLVRHALKESRTQGIKIEEWRVTGPEAWNRAFSASDDPVLMLPSRWIYPYK
eukprot:864629-Prymnesium_polylepis.1